jgi:flagellar protein FlaJ
MTKVKFKRVYLLSILVGLALIVLDVLILQDSRFFAPSIIVALIVGSLHFWIDFFSEIKRQKQIELEFLEFARSLVESVKSGVSINKSIQNIAKKDYGELNPYIKKLSNQLSWGITTKKALTVFANDTKNKVIKRSISIITEAEQSGGDISDILSSVVDSVMNIKKLREERKAMVYSQIVQGYLIYYIFIAIMISLDLWLFPNLQNVGAGATLSAGMSGLGGAGTSGTFDISSTFFGLIMVQGFFAGIMIGKFSEGTFRNGLFHSLILMVTAALIITTVKGGI